MQVSECGGGDTLYTLYIVGDGGGEWVRSEAGDYPAALYTLYTHLIAICKSVSVVVVILYIYSI